MAKIFSVPAATTGGIQQSYEATKGVVTKRSGAAGGFITVGPSKRTSDGGKSLDTIPATANIGKQKISKRFDRK